MNKAIMFKPGIDQSSTDYALPGTWYESNAVRFRDGFPESIGGWVDVDDFSLLGVGREIFTWTAFGNRPYTFVGTHWKAYVIYEGTAYDITPIRDSGNVSGTISFDTTLTSFGTGAEADDVVQVTHVAHGLVQYDFITFDSLTIATGGVGGITQAQLDGARRVYKVISSDKYLIIADNDASSSDTQSGSGGTFEYEINVASNRSFAIIGGYGSGAYGAGPYGESTTTSSSSEAAIRHWSVIIRGNDIIFSPRGSKIYYWNVDDSTTGSSGIPDGTRGIDFATYAGAVGGGSGFTDFDVPIKNNAVLMSGRNGHLVSLGTQHFSTTSPNPNSLSSALIRWSDNDLNRDNIFDWASSGENTSGGQVLDKGSEIIGHAVSGSEILIWTDRQMYSMKWVGPPSVFRIDEVTGGNVSLYAPNATVSEADVILFMGDKTFYEYRGSVNPLPCPLEKLVFEDINHLERYKIFTGYNPRFSEVTWFYPSSNSFEVDRYITYNYEERLWYHGNLDMSSISTSGQATTTQSYSRLAWELTKMTRNPGVLYLKDYDTSTRIPTYETSIYEHEVNYAADGRDLDSHINSSFFELGEGDDTLYVSDIIPDLQFLGAAPTTDNGGVTINLAGKAYPFSAETVKSSKIHSETDHKSVRLRARQCAFRLTASTTTYGWRLGKNRLRINADGRT